MSKFQWRLMENAISFSDRIKLAKFILSTNKFTNGERVVQLENEWNDWLGAKHSLFVSSGSTANFLLLAAIKELYNLPKNSKVLVPACTWTTNVSPIIQLGLKPIFCDIRFDDFSFDVDSLKYISQRHPDIKLIFVTHLLGFTSSSRVYLEKFFPNALIIDDVCESHGCKDNQGKKIGSDSLGATFSTYFGHHLTSIEGGFVSTNNTELYDLMKMKRSHGMSRESIKQEYYNSKYPDIDSSFLFVTDGYNFRNTEVNAVLGSIQLKRLDKSIEIRNKNFFWFCDLTRKYSNIIKEIKFKGTSSNFCFPIICRNVDVKNRLIELLSENNIEYRPVVSGNLLNHPFLQKYKISSDKKQLNIDIIHELGLYIGNNQFVGKKHLEKLDYILEKVNDNVR